LSSFEDTIYITKKYIKGQECDCVNTEDMITVSGFVTLFSVALKSYSSFKVCSVTSQ